MIDYKIGDCREVLKTLPEKSIHCCVTSPPYYGLRDYGVEGQIGLEKTPDEYVNELVNVFREVKRVLRGDGTLWLNLGDSYAANRSYQVHESKASEGNTLKKGSSVPNGIKPKDLIGIPWRVAFALQADGWYLRSDIIWSKPNPMPESVTDRPTKAHEYVFLLSKSEKYFYDNEAVKEQAAYDGRKDTVMKGSSKYFEAAVPGQQANSLATQGQERWPSKLEDGTPARNRRSVWNIPTKPYLGAHFATFPLALVEPCLKAGCPVGGTALDPFGGSGTVGEWCRHNGRNAILIELNNEYEPLIKDRCMINIPELSNWS